MRDDKVSFDDFLTDSFFGLLSILFSIFGCDSFFAWMDERRVDDLESHLVG